jgi:septum formation protein
MDFQLPKDVQVVLASKSPRRRELLTDMGIPFICITEEVDESFPHEMHPHAAVVYLSRKKAEAVKAIAPENAIIIASDTMVEVDGIPLGKPENEADAERMLWMLSGRHHNVHTGVCVMWGDKTLVGVDATDVFFLPLDREDILRYIATGEPMDKAGAYGIQGEGGKFISHINGNFDTVMGLPCDLVETLLKELIK